MQLRSARRVAHVQCTCASSKIWAPSSQRCTKRTARRVRAKQKKGKDGGAPRRRARSTCRGGQGTEAGSSWRKPCFAHATQEKAGSQIRQPGSTLNKHTKAQTACTRRHGHKHAYMCTNTVMQHLNSYLSYTHNAITKVQEQHWVRDQKSGQASVPESSAVSRLPPHAKPEASSVWVG